MASYLESHEIRTLWNSVAIMAERRSYNGVMTPDATTTTIPVLGINPISPGDYVEFLQGSIFPGLVGTGSPRCLAHMARDPFPFVALLDGIVSALNANLVRNDASGSLAYLERRVVADLHRIVYRKGKRFYSQNVSQSGPPYGLMCSGGTIANITALWIARKAADESAKRASHFNPSVALPKKVIIGSSLMHYSIDKAADLLGFDPDAVIRVPVARDGRVRCDALRECVTNSLRSKQLVVAIIGVAGTTDTGAFDSLPDLADIAMQHGVHFHVDAAWGGAFLLSRKTRRWLKGVERADSVSLDGHKQLRLPIGASVLLVKHLWLCRVIERHCGYILRDGEGDLGAWSLEGSRRAVALLWHAALNVVGLRQYERMMDACVSLANATADYLRECSECALVVDTTGGIVVYTFIPVYVRDRFRSDTMNAGDYRAIGNRNQTIRERQMRAGTGMVGITTLKGGNGLCEADYTVLRIVCEPFAGLSTVVSILDEQRHINRQLESHGCQ